MKPIYMSRLSIVAGGELQQYYRERGPYNGPHLSFGAHGNRDGSTDLYLKSPSGNELWRQNTGVGLACHMVRAGVGTIAGTLTMDPVYGAAAGWAAGHGCNAIGHSSRSGR